MDTPPTIGMLSPFVSGFYFGQRHQAASRARPPRPARACVAIQTADPGVVYSERADNSPRPHAAAWAHLAGCIVLIDARDTDLPRGDPRSGKPIVLISKQIDGLQAPDGAARQPGRRERGRPAPDRPRPPQDRVRRA